MAKRAARTDPHRPGAIMPSQYSYVLSYNLSTSEDGWPIPSFGINCALDRRVTIKDQDTGKETITNGKHDADGECCQCGLLDSGKKVLNGPGKCTVCGAAFIYGDIWKHEPTGEYIHLGHDCAEKYQLLADRSEWEMADAKARRVAITMATRASNEGRMLRFCEKHDGLLVALQLEHPVVQDIKRKLREYGDLSPKQIALVFRLANSKDNPEPEEVTVKAPTGKMKFRGVLVSKKNKETYYGIVTKIVVKVTTPDGVWLAWGTAPSGLYETTTLPQGVTTSLNPVIGDEVEISCTLEAGSGPEAKEHFVFMKRPRGKVVRRAQENAA